MESKINGSVYHKFINNYQRPILSTKREGKKSHKEPMNKKNTSDSFHSKLIYVNKKTGNIPLSQNDFSSETKSLANISERTLNSLQNANKSEKNGFKTLLNDNNRLNVLINGLPLNQKVKRKNNQSVNNDLNKLNTKSIDDEENTINNNSNSIFKRDKNKNNKNEYLHNTVHRLKKIQTNNINLNTNGNLENANNFNTKLVTNYTSNNIEPKRKKNFSLNYENEINIVSSNLNNVNINTNKDENDEFEYEYKIKSNKIKERKKNFIRENTNNKDLSRLIQENCTFNFHRKFNNYTDFNKNNSMLINNSNNMNSRINNNSIDCNFTDNYKRESTDLKDEFFHTTKTYDEKDNTDIPIKSEINLLTNKNTKNVILSNNIQKKN